MAKQLKDVLAGVKASKRIKTVLGKDPGVDYRPKAKDEADWADKHEIERHEDRVGNGDDVYQATNVKYSLASPKEDKHGMERPKDKKVYEAKETEEATCNESPAGKMCPVHGIKECSYSSRLRENEKYIGFTKLKRKLVNEVMKKSDPAGKWISDFVHSDNPKFKGKSPEKRKQMALAAYYAKQRNEEVEEVNEARSLRRGISYTGKGVTNKETGKTGMVVSSLTDGSHVIRWKGEKQDRNHDYNDVKRNIRLHEDLAMPLLGSHDSDEAVDMLKTELKALANKAMHLVMAMPDGMHVEPWVQSKIAQAKEMVSSVHDYMVYGDHDKEEKEQTAPYEGGIDPSSGNVRNMYPNFSADVNTGRNV